MRVTPLRLGWRMAWQLSDPGFQTATQAASPPRSLSLAPAGVHSRPGGVSSPNPLQGAGTWFPAEGT